MFQDVSMLDSPVQLKLFTWNFIRKSSIPAADGKWYFHPGLSSQGRKGWGWPWWKWMEMVDMVEKKIPFVDDLVCAIQPISRKKNGEVMTMGA